MERKPELLVFISYSSKQTSIAGQVCDYLENHGVRCWIAPRNIGGGRSYPDQIVKAIKECAAFVLIASKSTNISNHIGSEIRIAFDNKRQIIPFVIEEMEFSDESIYFLGGRQRINAFYDFNEGLDELLETIKQTESDVPPAEDDGYNMGEGESAPEAPVHKAQKLDRNAVIKRIIDKAEAYSDEETERFEDAADLKRLDALAKSIFRQTTSIHKYNKPVKAGDPIDFLTSEITDMDDEDYYDKKIKVSGPPGAGKKILIQLLFWKLMQDFKSGETNFCPFYLALSFFEKARYDPANVEQQVKTMMNRELDFFFEFCEADEDIVPVLLIDDVRDHYFGKIELEKILNDILEEHRECKQVVCVDTDTVKSKDRIKHVMPILPSTRVSVSCVFDTVDAHDENKALRFISDVISYFEIDVEPGQVYEIIRRFRYQEIDMFIVMAIGKQAQSSAEDIVSIGNLYHEWALEPVDGEEEQLRQMAEDISEYIFNEDYDMDRVDFFNPQWALIHMHATFLDFLIGYHFIQLIDDYDGQENFDCEFFGLMATSTIDLFTKDLVASDRDLQDRLFNVISDNFEKFTTVQKTSAVFWLAKIPRKNTKTSSAAIKFLKEQYAKYGEAARMSDNNSQENNNAQFLFRGICYALIVFGQAKILDDYLCLLVSNDSANEINRGAIIEYYGDSYNMAANEVYCFDNDPAAGERAIKALIWKVKNEYAGRSSTFPEIDLISLCTLLQMRIQSSEAAKHGGLTGWVKEAMSLIDQCRRRAQNTGSDRIDFYLSSVRDDFEAYLDHAEGFDISQMMYNTLRSLRNIKRKQWSSHRIDDPESVAEHLYSTWMMAVVFLPNEPRTEDEEGYSKQKILDMLLIHDMAEAELGDQVGSFDEPRDSLTEHDFIMRKLLLKGSYPNIASLTYYYDIWDEYFEGDDLNARIARDINIIQSVYTFKEYTSAYPDKFCENDRYIWMENKNKIDTEIGYSIYEKLIENNEDYSRSLTYMNLQDENK